MATVRYQYGLRDAAALGAQQYAEGLRPGLDRCPTLSSVNDAAVWIAHAATTNFPTAVQIVDWSHAAEDLYAVGNTVFGEGTARSATWTQTRLDELGSGTPWRWLTTSIASP